METKLRGGRWKKHQGYLSGRSSRASVQRTAELAHRSLQSLGGLAQVRCIDAIISIGDLLGQMTKKTIRASIDRRRETPFAADQFLKCMRGLFRWAAGAGLVDHDPTEGLKASTPRTEGFHAWSEEEVAKFEKR